METDQFDQLACRVAARSNRRGLLGALAGGSILAAFGPRGAVAEMGSPCALDATITIRLGADAGQVLWTGAALPGQLRGRLQFETLANGALGNAIFQVSDGTIFPVVGQATGHALQARIALGEGRALVLVGVGEQEIGACSGAVDGLVSGPQPGDLGDWQAIGYGVITAETTSAEAAPVAPTPTPSPFQPPEAGGCAQGLTQCENLCVDVSLDSRHCGFCGNACGMNGHCDSGHCVRVNGCPDWATDCYGNCVDLSSDPANCGYCGTLCGQVESCIDGICVANDFCQPGMTLCGNACADLTSSFYDCGACFMACEQGQTCWDGVCMVLDGCAEGYVDCGGLCVDLFNDSLNCGACGIQCHEGTVCSQGVCPPVQVECLAAGEYCLVNWDCCSGLCNFFDYSYTCL